VKKITAIAGIFVLVLAVFSFPSKTFATTLSNQPVFDTVVASDSSSVLFRLATTTQAQTINAIALYLSSTSSPPTLTSVRFTCFANTYSSSQTGCTNINPIYSNAGIQNSVSGAGLYVYYFASTTLVLQSGKSYIVEVNGEFGKPLNVFGKSTVGFATQCKYPTISGTTYCTGEPYYVLDGVFSSFAPVSLGIGGATSSALFSGLTASSTLTSLASQCSQQGNLFAEGLCTAFAFLFVPAPNTLDAYPALRDTLATKFPFSYVTSVTDTWDALVASSTANMNGVSIGLHDAGIGSTTPMGNILPNLSVLSVASLETYLSESVWTLLKGLASIAIWLTLILDIFFSARNLIHPK